VCGYIAWTGLCGVSQEPRVTQHRQCLHQLGAAPKHGTQTWTLITKSINSPRQGKIKESGTGAIQE